MWNELKMSEGCFDFYDSYFMIYRKLCDMMLKLKVRIRTTCSQNNNFKLNEY